MGVSSTESRGEASEFWSCGCYVCGRDVLWEIEVPGEGEDAMGAFACELHARGHLHVAIVLPEHIGSRAPYVGQT